jgi:CspA family cold shock protein
MVEVRRSENFREWVVKSRLEARVARLEKEKENTYIQLRKWESMQRAQGRLVGIVKWFDKDKGFGYISQEKGEDIFVHFSAFTEHKVRLLQPDQYVAYLIADGKEGRQIAQDVFPLIFLITYQSENLTIDFKNEYEEAFSHLCEYSSKIGAIAIQKNNANIFARLEEYFPVTKHTDVGRLFTTVRRMTAEKQLGLPIKGRSGFAISVKAGVAANELAAEDWDLFYRQMLDRLLQDYPDHYSRLFTNINH